VKNNFVFDTNTLVSSFFSPDSTPARAFFKAMNEKVVLYSGATLDELVEVLFRVKFDKYFTVETRTEILNRFLLTSTEVKPDLVVGVQRPERQ
jgi:uncharacterized protein